MHRVKRPLFVLTGYIYVKDMSRFSVIGFAALCACFGLAMGYGSKGRLGIGGLSGGSYYYPGYSSFGYGRGLSFGGGSGVGFGGSSLGLGGGSGLIGLIIFLFIFIFIIQLLQNLLN